jgi:hypothetical protein
MAEFPVKYILYASDGVTPVYTFTYVQDDTHFPDPKDFVEITSLRGVGSIIIPGSTQAFDINIKFKINGIDYEDLMSKLDSMKSSIVMQTRYILKIDRTPTSTVDFNVMRLQSFTIASDDFRTGWADVECVLRANTW